MIGYQQYVYTLFTYMIEFFLCINTYPFCLAAQLFTKLPACTAEDLHFLEGEEWVMIPDIRIHKEEHIMKIVRETDTQEMQIGKPVDAEESGSRTETRIEIQG